MKFRYWLLAGLILARFFDIEVRPPHHDEAVNAWFVDGIFQNGFYHYDPSNYHGPFYFYLLTLFEAVFGRALWVLRLPSLIAGVLVSLTPFLFRRWLGQTAAWVAAFFLAVSPAMVFYSRYAIHEMWFALACITFYFFYLLSRQEGLTPRRAIYLGLLLGLMASLKETFVIYLGTLLIAEGVCFGLNKWLGLQWGTVQNATSQNKAHRTSSSVPYKNVAVVLGIAFLVIVMNFTALGRDPVGIVNFFKAFAFWSHTGEVGNGHQKPFFYWVIVFYKYENFALLGLLCTPLVFLKASRELKLTSILGFGLWLAYSLISYKTAWCVLSFYVFLVFVGAYWFSKVKYFFLQKTAQKGRLNALGMIVLLLTYGYGARQAVDVSWLNPDQDHHEYIYGATYREFMVPCQEILKRVHDEPHLKDTLRIQVVSQFTWPLPFILGELKKVAYYNESNSPEKLDADYLLIDEALYPKVQSKIVGDYLVTTVKSRQWASKMMFLKRKK